MGDEVAGFASGKSRELADKARMGAGQLKSAATERAYRVALGVVAEHAGLTPEEVESRLGSPRNNQF